MIESLIKVKRMMTASVTSKKVRGEWQVNIRRGRAPLNSFQAVQCSVYSALHSVNYSELQCIQCSTVQTLVCSELRDMWT